MALQPTFTPREPVWRGNSSSADMNSNFEEILYDLNTIFEEASQQAIALEELKSTLKHEVDALDARLYAVSGMMQAFQESASGYKMFHEEFYRTKNIVYPAAVSAADRCDIHTAFGQVTLPVSNSFSKVYTININTGDIYVSPDLDVSVTPIDEAGNLRVEETSPLRAFNGNNSSFWERKVRFSRDYSKPEVSCQMDIVLPSMSNPNVNAFYIYPYPEGTADITEITYNTLTSQDNVLPGFPAGGAENITKSAYRFDDIQPVSFSIKFKQDNNALEDNYKTFVYGAQEIGISKAEYRVYGSMGVKFILPAYETGLLSKITSLSTSPNYDNIYYKLSVFPTLGDFDANTPIWTSANSAITETNQLDVASYAIDSIYVLVELTQEVGSTSTPVLESITMTYTTA
jgi:hypothetical protein